MTPLFFSSGSLSLGLTRICLMVLLPLKWVLMPYFRHVHLMLSPRPCTYGMTMCPALGFAPGVVLAWLLLLSLGPVLSCIVLLTWVSPCSSQLPFNTLFCTLFMAHLGYLHLTDAFLRCCNSSSESPGVVQRDLALWVSVPMTLYLAERLLWLSHCKYWSVWVGLQYTIMLRELTAFGWTKVSRKGIAPFSRLPLAMNFILGSMLLIWSKRSCLWAGCWMTQDSSTNLYQNLGGEADLSASSSKWSMYRRPPHSPFYLFIKLVLIGEVCIMQTELQQLNDVLYW